MTAYNATGVYVPHGINEQNIAFVEVIVPAMSSSDTLSVQLPGGSITVSPGGGNDTINPYGDQQPVDFSSLPLYAVLWDTTTNAGGTPAVLKAATTLPITSHNQSTGVTLLTAGASVTAGWTLLIGYLQPN